MRKVSKLSDYSWNQEKSHKVAMVIDSAVLDLITGS